MPNPMIRCHSAANASALTGTGTNTYLLGQGDVVVVDPGPDLPGQTQAILDRLGPGERVAHILVTHAHVDHSEAARPLAALTHAPIWAFGTAHAGRSALMQELALQGMISGEGADEGFAPDHLIADGARLTLAGLQIEALHLPGHMGCHMGFAIGDILLSGDHVMGWSTTLVSPPDGDMAAYMASLHRLAARNWARFLPGHGPQVTNPAQRLAELITHRLSREAAILAALKANGPLALNDLTALVYTDIARHLLPAAARNVLAHLIDLSSRGDVTPGPGPLTQAIFRSA